MKRVTLEALGCTPWELVDFDDKPYVEGVNEIMLVPKKEFDMIPNGTVLYSIMGEKVVKGKDYINEDTRCGFLAFGVVPED